MTIPYPGDLVWINFSPQAGHEQNGRRPAIVLSDYDFNDATGLAVVCPITSQKKGYPFEVSLPDGLVFNGVALTDQFRSLDYRARRVDVVGKVPPDSEFMASVMRNVRSILA